MNNEKLSEWTINVTFRLRFYRATVKNNKRQRQGYIYVHIYVTRKFLHLKSAVSILTFYRVMQFYLQRMHNLRTHNFLPLVTERKNMII